MISTRSLFCGHSASNIWFWGRGLSEIPGSRSDNVSSVKVPWSIRLEVFADYALNRRHLGLDTPKGNNFRKTLSRLDLLSSEAKD